MNDDAPGGWAAAGCPNENAGAGGVLPAGCPTDKAGAAAEGGGKGEASAAMELSLNAWLPAEGGKVGGGAPKIGAAAAAAPGWDPPDGWAPKLKEGAEEGAEAAGAAPKTKEEGAGEDDWEEVKEKGVEEAEEEEEEEGGGAPKANGAADGVPEG